MASDRLDHLGAVANLDGLDPRPRMRRHPNRNLCRAGSGDVTHHLRAVRRICRHIQIQAASGGGVVMPRTHRLEQGRARVLGGEETGQPAIGPEIRTSRIARARAPFVAIAVGDNADAAAKAETVSRHPFEGSPVGMDFDSRLQIGIMVYLDIRIAPANMGENHRVLAALAKRFIKVGDGVGVILQLVPLFQQRVRASPQHTALIGIDHIAVAAHSRVA